MYAYAQIQRQLCMFCGAIYEERGTIPRCPYSLERRKLMAAAYVTHYGMTDNDWLSNKLAEYFAEEKTTDAEGNAGVKRTVSHFGVMQPGEAVDRYDPRAQWITSSMQTALYHAHYEAPDSMVTKLRKRFSAAGWRDCVSFVLLVVLALGFTYIAACATSDSSATRASDATPVGDSMLASSDQAAADEDNEGDTGIVGIVVIGLLCSYCLLYWWARTIPPPGDVRRDPALKDKYEFLYQSEVTELPELLILGVQFTVVCAVLVAMVYALRPWLPEWVNDAMPSLIGGYLLIPVRYLLGTNTRTETQETKAA